MGDLKGVEVRFINVDRVPELTNTINQLAASVSNLSIDEAPAIETGDLLIASQGVIDSGAYPNAIACPVAPEAFVPDVKDGLVQMLTLDLLFVRLARYMYERTNDVQPPIAVFDITASLQVADLSNPIYMRAQDAVLNEIRSKQFAVAA